MLEVCGFWLTNAQSNRIKVLEDALQGVAFLNDSQVVELTAALAEDKANPRMEVTVERAA